eukprot:15462184-Alexandrium_andersonii.AAC.1
MLKGAPASTMRGAMSGRQEQNTRARANTSCLFNHDVHVFGPHLEEALEIRLLRPELGQSLELGGHCAERLKVDALRVQGRVNDLGEFDKAVVDGVPRSICNKGNDVLRGRVARALVQHCFPQLCQGEVQRLVSTLHCLHGHFAWVLFDEAGQFRVELR